MAVKPLNRKWVYDRGEKIRLEALHFEQSSVLWDNQNEGT
jgi:hypothetical protein